MKDPLEKVAFTIALSIGSNLVMDDMLHEALSCYLEGLGCSHCSVWEFPVMSPPEKIFSISSEDFTDLDLDRLQKKIASFSVVDVRGAPSPVLENSFSREYNRASTIMKLPDFGLIHLVFKGKPPGKELLAILDSLNSKLARSCIACRSYASLKDRSEKTALMEKAFRKSEERFHLALEATNDGIWDWDIRTGKVYFSPSYYSMLGYQPYELPQTFQTWEELLHPEERERVKKEIFSHIEHRDRGYEIEFRLRTRGGDWLWVQGRGRVVEWDRKGVPSRLVGTHSDISRRKQYEEQMEKMNKELYISATTDRLTGLVNRQRFEEILILEMDRAARYGNPLSLLMFDIDDFKRLNDTLGHQAGDTVLQEISQIILGRIRSSDHGARWGGDEFMILLLAEMDNALGIADSLRQEVASTEIPGIGRVTISIGLARYTEKDDLDSLVKRADVSLYRAKSKGKNRIEKE